MAAGAAEEIERTKDEDAEIMKETAGAELYLRGVDVDDFRRQVVADVVAALSPLLKENEPPLLVDRHRMAKLAGISVPTLDRLVSEGVVPSKSVGSRRLFSPLAVIDAIPSSN